MSTSEIVGLVTVYHVERVLPAVRHLPFIERSRSTQAFGLQKLERDGTVKLKNDYRDAPFRDSGHELKQFRRKYLRGAVLAQYLAEPRIVFVPDERPPKAKWKAEFRKEWPNSNGFLPTPDREHLIAEIGSNTLQIAGVWRNPTVDREKFEEPFWLNVVLACCTQPTIDASGLLAFEMRGQDLWAKW